jgi:hypothetical protein
MRWHEQVARQLGSHHADTEAVVRGGRRGAKRRTNRRNRQRAREEMRRETQRAEPTHDSTR